MLNKIFNGSNPFWQSMTTLFDLFILNTLWLLLCIPVITIGPATTAAYYALIQRARKEDRAGIHKDFFYSFKANLKPGIRLGVPLTLVGVFLLVDIYLCRKAGTGIFTFFMVFFFILFVFWAFTTLYAFPILAKFERRTRDILVWAFTLSIKNLSMTLTMLFVIAAGIWMCHLLPGLILIMFGIVCQFNSNVLAAIFKPFLPKPFYLEEDDFMASTDDQTYADFNEAVFYGEDPAEVEKLLKDYGKDEKQG